MRVLYVINSMGYGGAESVVRNLLTHFAAGQTAHEAAPQPAVDLLTLYQLGDFGEQARAAGVQVFALDAPGKYAPALVPRLANFIRRGHYDLVHAHLFPASYFAALASLLVRKPVWVFTEHNVWNRRRAHGSLRPLDRWVYSRFARILAVSDAVAAALAAWQPHLQARITTLPNAVPLPSLPAPRPTEASRLRLLFAGRLAHAKGVDVLLQAVSLVPQVAWELFIAGDGTLRAELETLAHRYGIADRVHFLGVRSDLPAFFQQADCLVLPSRWEGLPMVILEAMSYGVPVIATPVGGIGEVITHDVNGWLVPCEDAPALAAQIQALDQNRPRLAAAGACARQTIEAQYALPVVAAQHQSLYAHLLQ